MGRRAINDMRAPGNRASERFAICLDNREYPASLELHKRYPVLSDSTAETYGEIRVVDESGEDYLYPVELFLLVELPKPPEVGNVEAWLEHQHVFEPRRIAV